MDVKDEVLKTGEQLPLIESFDPNLGRMVGQVRANSADEALRAVATARQAQSGWAALPLDGRLRIMRQVQAALVSNADEIASLVTQEVGKPLTESLVGDVLLVLTSLTGYMRIARRTLRPRPLSSSIIHFGKKYMVVHEPLGVVAVISPFNFPVLLSMQATFAALIAGNAVVQKASEHAPLIAELIREIVLSAGLDPDLFQVLQGFGDTGWALVHSGVDHISFVGSTRTGRKIAGAAGEMLISSTMELGGNNAMIVLKDAPLDRAANAAMTYANANSGQMCGAIARVFVHVDVMDKLEGHLREKLRIWRASNRVGPGESEVTALVSEQALEQVNKNVQDALRSGATYLAGGGPLEGSKAPIFQPTILTNTSPEMLVRREETFGPVFSLIPFEHEDEAISMANETEYGLTASVWTRDLNAGWRIARRLQTGSVAVNDHLWPFFAPEAPWGGIKHSGMGRIGGEWGLKSMTYPKVISFERTTRKKEFYWYPVTARTHRLIRELIPLLYSPKLTERLSAATRILRHWFKRG